MEHVANVLAEKLLEALKIASKHTKSAVLLVKEDGVTVRSVNFVVADTHISSQTIDKFYGITINHVDLRKYLAKQKGLISMYIEDKKVFFNDFGVDATIHQSIDENEMPDIFYPIDAKIINSILTKVVPFSGDKNADRVALMDIHLRGYQDVMHTIASDGYTLTHHTFHTGDYDNKDRYEFSLNRESFIVGASALKPIKKKGCLYFYDKVELGKVGKVNVLRVNGTYIYSTHDSSVDFQYLLNTSNTFIPTTVVSIDREKILSMMPEKMEKSKFHWTRIGLDKDCNPIAYSDEYLTHVDGNRFNAFFIKSVLEACEGDVAGCLLTYEFKYANDSPIIFSDETGYWVTMYCN